MGAMRLLHLVAYRGNSAEFPENSLLALRSAIALGVRFIEVDVHLSADGIPMACSEHALALVTGGSELTAAQMSSLDVGQPERFGARFHGTLLPSLAKILGLLEGRPEITLFVTIGRASVARFGHDQVVSQVMRALQPFGSRCVLVSRDLATIHAARARAAYPIGWILPSVDSHSQLKYEALQPEYLLCESQHLPARLPQWRGPWRWAVYEESAGLEAILALGDRGVDFVVTRHVRSLSAAMREHAAAHALTSTGERNSEAGALSNSSTILRSAQLAPVNRSRNPQ